MFGAETSSISISLHYTVLIVKLDSLLLWKRVIAVNKFERRTILLVGSRRMGHYDQQKRQLCLVHLKRKNTGKVVLTVSRAFSLPNLRQL